MEEGFDIHIKDNFLDKEMYKLIYDKISFYVYSGNYGYHNTDGNLIKKQNSNPEHLFYGATVEKDISNYIREKCEKLYNKKFKENYSAYTMVTRTTPMVHCDKGEKTSHQIRAVFWESSVYHSPLIWSDDNKNKRFSIIAQYKEK